MTRVQLRIQSKTFFFLIYCTEGVTYGGSYFQFRHKKAFFFGVSRDERRREKCHTSNCIRAAFVALTRRKEGNVSRVTNTFATTAIARYGPSKLQSLGREKSCPSNISFLKKKSVTTKQKKCCGVSSEFVTHSPQKFSFHLVGVTNGMRENSKRKP